MPRELHGELTVDGQRFALIVSRFNEVVTEQLEAGARETLQRHGVEPGDIDVVAVPGAWELPYAARLAGERGYAGIVALGCVIRGETPHFDYVCLGAARGLEAAGRSSDAPVRHAGRNGPVDLLHIFVQHPNQAFDVDLIDWADASDMPLLVLLNKTDKLKRNAQIRALHAIERITREMPSVDALLFSAAKGLGGDAAVAWVRGHLKDRSE